LDYSFERSSMNTMSAEEDQWFDIRLCMYGMTHPRK
jgi:hypothetical protein